MDMRNFCCLMGTNTGKHRGTRRLLAAVQSYGTPIASGVTTSGQSETRWLSFLIERRTRAGYVSRALSRSAPRDWPLRLTLHNSSLILPFYGTRFQAGSLQGPTSLAPSARTRTQTLVPDTSVSLRLQLLELQRSLSTQFVGGMFASVQICT